MGIIKKLPIKISNVHQIYEISDIQIRPFRRHQEYTEVFNKLYTWLQYNLTTDDLIYIAGDVVHSKIDISPELITMVTEFLDNISNIAPTIMIRGNHDALLSNPNRVDTLTPIVKTLKNKNFNFRKFS